MQNAGKQKTRRKISISPMRIGIVAVLAIIIIYLAYALLQPGIINITSSTATSSASLSIAANQTVAVRIYGEDVVALRLQAVSNTSATFRISRLPVLYGQVVSITLSPETSANISSNGTRIADMNMMLASANSKGAVIKLYPVLTSLGIRPSAGATLLSPSNFSIQGKTPNVTTTILNSSAKTTTVATTTMVQNSTALLFQQALALMNKTNIGALMVKYKALYIKDASCNQTTYDTVYFKYYSSVPPAPLSFTNMSQFIPRNLKINETALPAKDNVLITYSTVALSPAYTGNALHATINTSALSFFVNASYTGTYEGLNYTQLQKAYNFQSKISNNCGAWISPPS